MSNMVSFKSLVIALLFLMRITRLGAFAKNETALANSATLVHLKWRVARFQPESYVNSVQHWTKSIKLLPVQQNHAKKLY